MYTQYFFSTQTINPAYVGTWDALGFMALTRQQWVGWDGAPRTHTFYDAGSDAKRQGSFRAERHQ